MSDVAKKININVGDVLKRGSNEMKMTELNKMGLTKVKVIRHSQVQELISQAVDNAIARFIFGAEGRKEHERLMSLLNEKEHALTDVSGEEALTLKSEVDALKRQVKEQNARLEEAKAKVVEDTKKEYEALAEKTSLENQLVMQKKAELELNRQLQEMTLLVGQLKEKTRTAESQHKEALLQLQELEKVSILEEEINSLSEENEKLLIELEKSRAVADLAAREKENSTGLTQQIKALEQNYQQRSTESQELKEQLAQQVSSNREEKKKLEEEILGMRDAVREKDFLVRELQNKLLAATQEKEELVSSSKNSAVSVDAELRRVLAEKADLNAKVSNAENSLTQVRDQLRDKEVAVQSANLKNEQLTREKEQEKQRVAALEDQLNKLREEHQNARLQNEKLILKEEITREKADELKVSNDALMIEKSKLIDTVTATEEENRKLNEQIDSLNQQLAQKSNEDQNAAMMEALKAMMTDMKGDLSEQINKVKLRAGSGGGGGSGGGSDYVELDPSIVLKNMFQEKLESNFNNVTIDSRKVAGNKKSFGKTLDALKSLRNNEKKEE